MTFYRKSYWKTTLASFFFSLLAGVSVAVWTAAGDTLLQMLVLPRFGKSILSWAVFCLLGLISLAGLMVGVGGVFCLHADSQESQHVDAHSPVGKHAGSSLH